MVVVNGKMTAGKRAPRERARPRKFEADEIEDLGLNRFESRVSASAQFADPPELFN